MSFQPDNSPDLERIFTKVAVNGSYPKRTADREALLASLLAQHTDENAATSEFILHLAIHYHKQAVPHPEVKTLDDLFDAMDAVDEIEQTKTIEHLRQEIETVTAHVAAQWDYLSVKAEARENARKDYLLTLAQAAIAQE